MSFTVPLASSTSLLAAYPRRPPWRRTARAPRALALRHGPRSLAGRTRTNDGLAGGSKGRRRRYSRGSLAGGGHGGAAAPFWALRGARLGYGKEEEWRGKREASTRSK